MMRVTAPLRLLRRCSRKAGLYILFAGVLVLDLALVLLVLLA